MATVKVLVLGSNKESNSQFCHSISHGHGTTPQDFCITKKKDSHTYILQFLYNETQIDRESMYAQANAFLILFNVDSGESFTSIEQQWIPEICEHVGGPAPIVIVGTHIDKRVKASSDKRVKSIQGHITTKQGEDLVARYKLAAYSECNTTVHASVAKVIDVTFHAFLEDAKAKKDPKHSFYHSLLPWGKKKDVTLKHSSSNPIPASHTTTATTKHPLPSSRVHSPTPPPKSVTPLTDFSPRKSSSSAPSSRPSSPPPILSALDNDYAELSYPPTVVSYQPPPPPKPPPVKKYNISRAPTHKSDPPPLTTTTTTSVSSPPQNPLANSGRNPPATTPGPNIGPTTGPNTSPSISGPNPVRGSAPRTSSVNFSAPASSSSSPATKKYGSVEWDIPAKDLVFISMQGKGAYGEVWKGKWTGRGGGLIVAIKKIPIWGTTERMRDEIFAEVSIMVKLRYPTIVTIYGRALTEQELFIVLEYVEGGDLASFLSSKEEIGWDVRVRLALEAARSVHYLHSLHPPVLHRDLKSPNFLVCKPNMSLKLTDFGMSKVKSIASNVTETTTTAAAGSYRWSAPETIAKYPKWTEKADIFSLGMVFYEIAARKIPFEEITESTHILFLVKSERERPDIPPDCPNEFAAVIEKCWEHDQDLRPTSGELLEMLQTLVENPLDSFSPRATRKLDFKIHEDLLFRCVTPDCVRVLTLPPPFPSSTISRPPVPSKVTLVRLSRAESNSLISKTYDAELFARVELHFRRFFAPKDSSLKVTLDEVDVILNEEVERRFTRAEADMHERFAGLAEMKDEDQSDLQQHYLNHLLTSQNLVPQRNSNLMSAWHGANSAHLDSICWYGMLNLSSNDPGYFGKGIYFTQRPKYGEYYAEACEMRTEGKFQLLLCWVLLGKPYAVTKVSMGRPCEKGYTSHYALVSRKTATREICATKADYESVSGLQNFFPVKSSGEEIHGDELAVFDSCHVLPRYIVHYSVDKDPHDKFRGVSFYNSV